MARPAGRKNVDFDAKAEALLERLTESWLRHGPGASLRELAESADLSVNNVRHYFGDRAGLVEAMLAHLHRRGEPHMQQASKRQGADAESSLRLFLHDLVLAWRRFGVGRVHAVTLGEGLAGPAVAPAGASAGVAYVQHVLEPTLQSLERLLMQLVADGGLPPLQPRIAGLALIGPVVLALLHQDNLGGVQCRPLDIDVFLEEHLRGWMRGWGPNPATMGPGAPIPGS